MADKKLMSALAYFFGFFSGVILLLIEKEDKYVRFHAAQSTLLFVFLFIIQTILVITVIGIFVLPFFGLISLVLWLFLMWKAYSGEQYALPLVGDWAKKLV